jgi:hypothetical protein
MESVDQEDSDMCVTADGNPSPQRALRGTQQSQQAWAQAGTRQSDSSAAATQSCVATSPPRQFLMKRSAVAVRSESSADHTSVQWASIELQPGAILSNRSAAASSQYRSIAPFSPQTEVSESPMLRMASPAPQPAQRSLSVKLVSTDRSSCAAGDVTVRRQPSTKLQSVVQYSVSGCSLLH